MDYGDDYCRNETRYTVFDPPTYSILDSPNDDDKPSDELLQNPDYIRYGKEVLGWNWIVIWYLRIAFLVEKGKTRRK